MYKLFCTVVFALTIFCGPTSSTNIFGKELVQDFNSCIARLPPPITGADAEWVGNQTKWYLRSASEIFFNRASEVFLAGKDDRPLREVRAFFDSPCLTYRNEFRVVNQAVADHFTTGALGITIPISTTAQNNGILTSVLNFPNSQTPALTMNWLPVHTDRQTYVLFLSCDPEGHYGFHFLPTKPEIDVHSIQEVKTYLDNAGFGDNLSAVTTYRASTCTNNP